MSAYVYLLASRRNGTLYVGVTTDLVARMGQHRAGVPGSFTTRYGVRHLVLVEEYPDIRDARLRERQIKNWRRDWKIELIETLNPDWRDLSGDYLM